MKVCTIENCNMKHKAKGLCDKHYMRLRKTGRTAIDGKEVEIHGACSSPEYTIWINMKQRCSDENHISYKRYGGRGIKVCEEWETSFLRFFNDMGKKQKGKQLDRIDNDGPYCKENCRWVTPSENIRNSTVAKLKETDILEIRKSKLTHVELAKKFGVSATNIRNIRLNKIWKPGTLSGDKK